MIVDQAIGCAKMRLDPTFWSSNERKVTMAKPRFQHDRLSNIVVICLLSEPKQEAVRPGIRWKEIIEIDLVETGTPYERVKRDALGRLEWRRSCGL